MHHYQSPQEKERPKDLNSQLGETLHLSMVRAVVEEGLAHHTPEALHELVRTGVYRESDVEVRLDRQEKKVPYIPYHTTGIYFTTMLASPWDDSCTVGLLLWVLATAGLAKEGPYVIHHTNTRIHKGGSEAFT